MLSSPSILSIADRSTGKVASNHKSKRVTMSQRKIAKIFSSTERLPNTWNKTKPSQNRREDSFNIQAEPSGLLSKRSFHRKQASCPKVKQQTPSFNNGSGKSDFGGKACRLYFSTRIRRLSLFVCCRFVDAAAVKQIAALDGKHAGSGGPLRYLRQQRCKCSRAERR